MKEELLNKVLTCSKTPSMPAVALKVVELTSDGNVSMRKLADVIEHDQGLSTKILKTVNSAFYALPKRCSTISRAQLVLGLKALKTLALGFSLVSTLRDDDDATFDYRSYWRRAVYTGVGAKIIASKLRCTEPEEAFLGGLLQDIGMLALYHALGDEYLKVVRADGGSHASLCQRELRAFELQHPEVGAMLATRWKLPDALVMPIRYHERPTAAPKDHADVVRCVGLGILAAETLSTDDPAPALSRFYKRAEEWFALSPGVADDLLHDIAAGAKELSGLFELDTGPAPDVASILEDANDRLVGMMLEEEQNSEHLARTNIDMQRALAIDSLTGLASRRRIAEALTHSVSKLRAGDPPIGLMLIDADAFRRINDAYGRTVGDAVLVRLGARIRDAFQGTPAVVGRYGGEEFAVLITGVERDELERRAEACRSLVATSPFNMHGCPGAPEEISVSVSVGLACLEGQAGDLHERCESLVNAADQAVRTAKRSGGDCVRLSTPALRAA